MPGTVLQLSFDDVYDRHFRFVWRVLRALGVPASAVDDAAQEVFVVVHRRLSEFEGRSDVRTWLYRIAAFVATSEKRRALTRGHEQLDDHDVRDGAAGPFETLARTEAMRRLETIVARMDPDKRLVFLLMDVEEMKATEVAELLELNANTVYSRLRLAREQFRRLVEETSESRGGSAA